MKLSSRAIAAICMIVWLIFVQLLLAHLPQALTGKLLAATAFVLATHILFAGYFLMTRLKRLDYLTVLYDSIIGILLLCIAVTTANYGLLAIQFVILFLAAMLLHQNALDLYVSDRVNRLAHYKIKLEFQIIIFILCESLLLMIFPGRTAWIAAIGLVLILIGNYKVIVVDRIYQD